MSSAAAQFLNFNIPSTTEGHLRTKYNVNLFLFFKSTYLSMHNDTRFGTDLFSVGTHRGNLLVNSRFSTGDLNFCVHSIPLCKNGSCSEHQCIGLLEEHCSNYVTSEDTSAVGKFTTAWVWHKAEQIIWISLAFSHAWMSDYICMYIYVCMYV